MYGEVRTGRTAVEDVVAKCRVVNQKVCVISISCLLKGTDNPSRPMTTSNVFGGIRERLYTRPYDKPSNNAFRCLSSASLAVVRIFSRILNTYPGRPSIVVLFTPVRCTQQPIWIHSFLNL